MYLAAFMYIICTGTVVFVYVIYIYHSYTGTEYMYGHQSMDQPGKVANPTRGQLNRGKDYFPVHVRG